MCPHKTYAKRCLKLLFYISFQFSTPGKAWYRQQTILAARSAKGTQQPLQQLLHANSKQTSANPWVHIQLPKRFVEKRFSMRHTRFLRSSHRNASTTQLCHQYLWKGFDGSREISQRYTPCPLLQKPCHALTPLGTNYLELT